MDREIKLTFNRKYFEEIYFKDNQGSYYKSPVIKEAFKNLSVVSILFIGVIVYSFQNDAYAFLFIGVVFLLIVFDKYIHIYWDIKKWRKQIKKSLDVDANCKEYILILSKDYFILKLDNEETFGEWKEMINVEVHDDYIWIEVPKGTQLFPKKSMSEDDFIAFKNLVLEKEKIYSGN